MIFSQAGTLIPSPDSLALPAPPLILDILLNFTFVLHVIFLNLMVGGFFLALFSYILFLFRKEERYERFSRMMAGANIFHISLTITTGIAPLLFLQILYGPFFYTATILMGALWLLVVFAIMGAYCMNYLFWHLSKRMSKLITLLFILVPLVLLLFVAFMQSGVSVLAITPERWTEVRSGLVSAFADPSILARLFHFLVAALGINSLFIIYYAFVRARGGGDMIFWEWVTRFGLGWARFAFALELFVGIWLVLALPKEVLSSLGTSVPTLVLLVLGIIVAMGGLGLLYSIRDPFLEVRRTLLCIPLFIAPIVLMVLVRNEVRGFYLSRHFRPGEFSADPQWGALVLFLLLLLIAIGVLFFMLRRVFRSRPDTDLRSSPLAG